MPHFLLLRLPSSNARVAFRAVFVPPAAPVRLGVPLRCHSDGRGSDPRRGGLPPSSEVPCGLPTLSAVHRRVMPCRHFPPATEVLSPQFMRQLLRRSPRVPLVRFCTLLPPLAPVRQGLCARRPLSARGPLPLGPLSVVGPPSCACGLSTVRTSEICYETRHVIPRRPSWRVSDRRDPEDN